MSDELLDANARNAADYSEDTIRHLDDMTHIRMRPGMYIGRLGDGSHAEDGIYVLLKESIDNSIDEFNEGFGKKIEVENHRRTHGFDPRLRARHSPGQPDSRRFAVEHRR